MRGEKSAAWKGGRHVTQYGYVKVYAPQHPRADGMGYVLEHRRVMEETLGRLLEPGETVHHIDGNRSNNAPSNLQVRVGKHGKGKLLVCADCGSTNIIARPLG
jgi:hypothetical protein